MQPTIALDLTKKSRKRKLISMFYTICWQPVANPWHRVFCFSQGFYDYIAWFHTGLLAMIVWSMGGWTLSPLTVRVWSTTTKLLPVSSFSCYVIFLSKKIGISCSQTFMWMPLCIKAVYFCHLIIYACIYLPPSQAYALHWTVHSPPELLDMEKLLNSTTMFAEIGRFVLSCDREQTLRNLNASGYYPWALQSEYLWWTKKFNPPWSLQTSIKHKVIWELTLVPF